MALTLAKTLKLSAAYDSHYLVQVGVNNMIIKSSENGSSVLVMLNYFF
jgi:hypothetical protein